MTSPADVHLVRYEAFSSVLLVSIHEGRNRQVRRMFSAIGHEVVSLKRVGFATIKLHDLPRGQWRRLTDVEVKKLKEYGRVDELRLQLHSALTAARTSVSRHLSKQTSVQAFATPQFTKQRAATYCSPTVQARLKTAAH